MRASVTSYEWGDELPRLEGPRVALRALRNDDASAIFAIFGDPEVMKFWSSPPLANLAAAEALIEEIRTGFQDRQLFQWGIELRLTGEVIGTCTLYHLEPEHRRGEIGFAARRSQWGQGLASEAVSLLIGFAFEALALNRLEADADPENERSLRALERQGFRREGYLRERWHHMGKVHDGVVLGLLRREWKDGRVDVPSRNAG